MSKPVVTLVICTRNRGNRLGAALNSLTGIESQISFEAILVDNASTDNTKAVISEASARDPRLRYLRVDRVGLGAGRDAAWRQAKGSIICFTDDDCYVAPDYVDQIVSVFAEFPNTGVIGGKIMLHDPDDAKVTIDESIESRFYEPGQVMLAGSLQGANLSFRREALEKAGGFDANLGAGTPFPAEDIDAVAAVVWAGYSARYDPRPVVSHHHGRKEQDIAQLFITYDAGRGAYWAKYMLRKDTRRSYMISWWGITKRYRTTGMLGRTIREIRSAASYTLQQGRYAAMVGATPAALGTVVYVGTRVAISATKRFLHKLSGR